jgi:hypothetical protein
MSGILIVAFVVSCGHQLLNCEDILTGSREFSNMAECHTRLADLISEQQLKEGPKRRVMGRCQYLLDERHSPDRTLLQTARAEQYPAVGFYQSTLDRGELSNHRKPQRQQRGAFGFSEHQPHRAKGQVPNNGLLDAMVNWLSIKFGLPLNHDHPTIKFLQTAQITQYRNRVSDRRGPEVIAFYDDAARTIFLPNNWTGSDPSHLSILVHEMVHHLQNVAELKYECAASREKTAYAAQEAWLAIFGQDLVSEFEIDRLTLKLATQCLYR